MNKVIIADQEFLITTQPLTIFIKLYGTSQFLIKLISQRFELYLYQSLDLKKLNLLFNFLSEFIPLKLGFKPLYTYNLIYLEYANTYKTYRHLFNLPVNGQRTWGGGRSIKFHKSQLYNYKLKKFTKQYGIPSSCFMAEIINLLWKQQWRHEWDVSKKYREKLPWYVQKKKKWLNLSAMISRRIESFYKHPYRFKKKKHHRKKKKINKHVITTGFEFSFSKYLLKNLNNVN